MRYALRSITDCDATDPSPCWVVTLELCGKRPVEQREQRVVLPEAQAERDDQRDQAHDQARAQLIEVVDDAQPIIVADGP